MPNNYNVFKLRMFWNLRRS